MDEGRHSRTFSCQPLTSGNDTIIGTDASEGGILGGTGDDRLEGAGGNDTYVIRIGDGRDVVVETASHDTDKIVFEGRASSTLRVVRDGDDAVLSFTDGSDTVRLTGQFFYSYFGYFFGQQRVENLVFEDKTISLHDLRQLYIDQASTSGADVIRGTEEGEVFAAGAEQTSSRAARATTFMSGRRGRERHHRRPGLRCRRRPAAGGRVRCGGDGHEDRGGRSLPDRRKPSPSLGSSPAIATLP